MKFVNTFLFSYHYDFHFCSSAVSQKALQLSFITIVIIIIYSQYYSAACTI